MDIDSSSNIAIGGSTFDNDIAAGSPPIIGIFGTSGSWNWLSSYTCAQTISVA